MNSLFRPDLCAVCSSTFEIATMVKNEERRDSARSEYLDWIKAIVANRQRKSLKGSLITDPKAIWHSVDVKERFTADWCSFLSDYAVTTPSPPSSIVDLATDTDWAAIASLDDMDIEVDTSIQVPGSELHVIPRSSELSGLPSIMTSAPTEQLEVIGQLKSMSSTMSSLMKMVHSQELRLNEVSKEKDLQPSLPQREDTETNKSSSSLSKSTKSKTSTSSSSVELPPVQSCAEQDSDFLGPFTDYYGCVYFVHKTKGMWYPEEEVDEEQASVSDQEEGFEEEEAPIEKDTEEEEPVPSEKENGEEDPVVWFIPPNSAVIDMTEGSLSFEDTLFDKSDIILHNMNDRKVFRPVKWSKPEMVQLMDKSRVAFNLKKPTSSLSLFDLVSAAVRNSKTAKTLGWEVCDEERSLACNLSQESKEILRIGGLEPDKEKLSEKLKLFAKSDDLSKQFFEAMQAPRSISNHWILKDLLRVKLRIWIKIGHSKMRNEGRG